MIFHNVIIVYLKSDRYYLMLSFKYQAKIGVKCEINMLTIGKIIILALKLFRLREIKLTFDIDSIENSSESIIIKLFYLKQRNSFNKIQKVISYNRCALRRCRRVCWK